VTRLFGSQAARPGVVVAMLVAFAAVAAVLLFANRGPAPQHRSFELDVAGSNMTPAQIQAYDGDTLSISVKADRAEEIHLHGYDKHFFPSPGHPVTLTFPGDRTGSFVLELEATSTPLGLLQVQPRGGIFGGGGSPAQSSTTVVRHAIGGVTETQATASYNLSLQLGGLQPMYTPAQAAAQHPNTGEIMFGGDMLMPPAASPPPDWRHLEVHVFNRTTGDVVKTIHPAITVTSRATGQTQELPVTTMQGINDGPGDFHYGNNVELPSGSYMVTVRIGSEVGTFDVAL
jgi:hypothetical protein